LEAEVLNILAYFDVFKHPLTKDEIQNLTLNGDLPQHVENSLKEMVDKGLCYTNGEYFSIQNKIPALVSERQLKEQKARMYFRKLPFYAKIIAATPFVRAVAVSGSLSKNIMMENGDIDYFIICAPNRLWISRTLLILFKKVFLLNSRRFFCVNYFVDENNLVIPDKNIFTAIEISYLLPIYNKDLVRELQEKNSWVKKIIPDFKHPMELQQIGRNNRLKRLIERILHGSLGNILDIFFMKLTLLRWKRKFKNFDSVQFEQTMRTNRGTSKHHPMNYQQKVLEEFDLRMNNLSSKI
jgi:hypothetical protein